MEHPTLVQISLSASAEKSLIVPAHRTTGSRRAHELNEFQKKLNLDLANVETRFKGQKLYSPHAIAVSGPMLSRLESMHLLLARAIVDVVDRWFSDEEAQLWKRMPLEEGEETFLRWFTQSERVPEYAGNAGFARTDVLFAKSKDGLNDEAPYFCEVNGRMPLNGMLVAWEQASAMMSSEVEQSGIEPLSTRERDAHYIKQHFDPGKPVFCVRDECSSVSSQTLEIHISQEVRVVRPDDLELRASTDSKTGYAIWHRPSNAFVEQWFSEIRHQDWATLDTDLAQHLCMTPLNDFRTMMLVNDKRLLGIIVEELPGMVARGVFTNDESNSLDQSIPETHLPGSKGLEDILRVCKMDPTAKNAYIYKLGRSEGGKGIDLGRNLTQEDWLSRLEKLTAPGLIRPSDDPAIIQHVVDQAFYDIVRHGTLPEIGDDPTKLHLIASCFMIHMQHFSHSVWSVGLDGRLALAPDNPGIFMSCVRVPIWPLCEQNELEI